MSSISPRPPPSGARTAFQGAVWTGVGRAPSSSHVLVCRMLGRSPWLAQLLPASPSVFPEWVETDSGFFFSFLFAVRGGGSCPLSNSKFLLFLELPLRGRTEGKPSWRLCLLACWHVLASPSCLGILEFQACVRGAWSVAGLLTPTFLLANVKLTWRQ